MNNFNYYAPTEVIFGKGTEEKVGKLVAKQNCRKVLIHYGSGSVVRSGLLDRVKKSLETEQISYVELGGAVPNPRLSLVYQGIDLCKKEGVDFILGVGGGSAIDSAKAIGYGVANEGDVWDFYDYKRQAVGCLPIGVILTIAATGTEMSDSSVITKEDGWVKRGYSNNASRPVFAVMNPELTMTLPDYQTACGCADILMHTMERYFSNNGHMEVTDSIAEALMRTVITNALILRDNPKDYDARAEIMWCGSISHNGLIGCGNDGGDWATHKLEHEIGGLYDVAHGAGLAAIWGSWARYVMDTCMDRFVRFAINVMGVKTPQDMCCTCNCSIQKLDQAVKQELALKGIEAMEEFYRSIKMPTSFLELGLTPSADDLALMAHKCSIGCGGTVGSARQLTETDMLKIYQMAL